MSAWAKLSRGALQEMKSAGRYEIQSPINSGAVDSYSARDPESGQTVLLHVLPPGHESDPKASFLQFAPGCPGNILDTGVDPPTQRAYVVTEYPKDRKALLLWIKSLSGIAAKPAAAKPAAPATPKPAPPPSPAAASDGATRMFDPAAIFGGAVAVPSEKPAAAAAAPEAGGTRMFDPAAIFGGPSSPAAAQPSAPPASDGATRMFDPAAVFGAGAAIPSAAQAEHPSAAQKTPPPPRDNRPRTDPFADLKAALARSGSGSQPAPAKTPDTAAKHGEFTRRFELPKEFRGAPMRVDRTSQTPAVKKPGATGDPTDPKGVLTLMMEAYAKRMDGGPEEKRDQPAPAPSGSDGATRMLDAAALFGDVSVAPPAAESPKPSATPDSQATQRMPAVRPEDEKK